MSIQSRMHQIDELVNERWLGISTTEWHQVHYLERPDFRGYGPTSYRDWRVMRRHFKPQGTFVDYGAGLGRVAILAAKLPFERVIGVDLDSDLVERGNQNIRRARGLKCPVDIMCRDATTFRIPDNASVLYFCNPFSGKVLAGVLERVQQCVHSPLLVCNLPNQSGFEIEMRAVPWLALQSDIALSGGRKCITFVLRERRPGLS